MNKKRLSLLSAILAASMLIAACARQGASVSISTADSVTERNTEVTDNISDSERVSDDSSDNMFGCESETESETDVEGDTETDVPLTGPDAELVSYANSISNKIDSLNIRATMSYSIP